jgi:hypothetical protein
MTIIPSFARRALTIAVLLAAVVASLASSSHPSVNSAAKADLDRRLAALQPKARDLPAPTAAEPLPLAPGQWVTLKQTDSDNRPSLVTYKIVGLQEGAFWYEVAIDSYYGHSASRMLLAVGDRKDPSTFDVRALITKDNQGRVNETPKEMLSMMKSTYQSMLDQLVIRWEQLPQEDVHVLGGNFAQCYKGRSTVSFMGYSATSDVWYHPAVPVNGMVKSVGVDKPMSSELVDFGMDGATSEF